MLLHLLVPAAHRVAVLQPTGPGQLLILGSAKKAAEAMGLIVVPISAPTPADLDLCRDDGERMRGSLCAHIRSSYWASNTFARSKVEITRCLPATRFRGSQRARELWRGS